MGWKSDLIERRKIYYEAGLYDGLTLSDAIREGAVTRPNVQMVFHSDTRPDVATLGDMHRKSVALAGCLQSLGLELGDVVAIQVPNWLEGTLMFQAALALGVVVLPIIHIYGPSEVSFILRQSGARAFICPDRWRQIDYLERLERLDRSALPQLEHVIVVGDPAPDTMSWAELVRREAPDFSPPPLHPDDVCLLVYTSGTTAEPKGVQHTHNTLLAEVRSTRRTLDVVDAPVNLSAFPAGHIAGVLSTIRLFVHGGRTVLMDTWNASAAARLVEEHRVTGTSGTPFHLATLLDAAEAGGYDLSSLQGYMSGAASVPPALIERAEAVGLPTYRAYGSSEHPTISSGSASDSVEQRATTDGPVLDGNEIRIIDDDGHDLPVGQAGEIVSRGPELFVGYRDEDLNERSFLPGGWFLTGDIGVLDDAGYLRITDRKKDVIIRGGENIASKEVEDILIRHPAVQESAVVAMPDERYGERVCAFIIFREGQSLDLEGVRDHFQQVGVAKQKTPEHLVAVEDFPRTAAGKVKKFALREKLRPPQE